MFHCRRQSLTNMPPHVEARQLVGLDGSEGVVDDDAVGQDHSLGATSGPRGEIHLETIQAEVTSVPDE